jgi:phosphatidylglycerophosphate synthase
MHAVRSWIERALTPAARRAAGVSPNLITGVAVLAGLGAGLCLWQARHGREYHALAALLLVVSGLADALDGIVARMYGRVTRLGEFLDHVGDRLVEVAIIAGIAVSPGATASLGAAALVLTLLHSYLGTQIEATFGRREYSGPGKAEQFIGLVLFALARFTWPFARLPLLGVAVSLPDACLVALGIGAVAGGVHRLRLAGALALQEGSPSRGRQTGMAHAGRDAPPATAVDPR